MSNDIVVEAMKNVWKLRFSHVPTAAARLRPSPGAFLTARRDAAPERDGASVLAIDVGAGTTDILFTLPGEPLENAVRLVVPSATQVGGRGSPPRRSPATRWSSADRSWAAARSPRR